MKRLLWKNIWQALSAIVFLVAVWGVAYFAVGNELLVPAFSKSLKEVGELFVSGAFWQGFSMSLLRAVYAFLLSFFVAAIFAVIAYLYPSFGGFLAPIVSAFRSLPVLAVLLILLSFLGAAEAPVAVAFLSLFPMLYAGILAALSSVDRRLIEVSRVEGTPLFRRVYAIYLPLSAPYILKETGAALSFSVKLVVSAEVLANTAKSLGGMMQEARVYAEIPQLFALVGVAFVAGLLMELVMALVAEAVEKRVG